METHVGTKWTYIDVYIWTSYICARGHNYNLSLKGKLDLEKMSFCHGGIN